MTDKTIEQRARELLAEEYEANGKTLTADALRRNLNKGGWCFEVQAAIRAIARALQQQGGSEGVRGLVANWRDAAVGWSKLDSGVDNAHMLTVCAYELEAALAAMGAAQQPEGREGGERPGPDWRFLYQGRRDVISRWHARAVALGYEGVEDLLSLALPCIVNNAGEERTAPPAKAPTGGAMPSGQEYTVERHGDGWAIYRGRDHQHHGMNLGHLTECDEQLAKMIERGLNAIGTTS